MNRNVIKGICSFFIIYFVFIFGFYFVGDKEIQYREKHTELPAADGALEEFSEGTVILQEFRSETDILSKLTFSVATYGRVNRGHIVVSLIDNSTQRNLEILTMESGLLEDNSLYEWQLKTPIENALGKSYTISVGSECPLGEAPTMYYQNGALPGFQMTVNGVLTDKMLRFSYAGYTKTFLGQYYWQTASLLTIVLLLYSMWAVLREKRGKGTIAGNLLRVGKRYKFLIQQLVARDFKTKYKRSVLGYLWSFLNPLLTMTVQYIVFSTIFRSDIKNFPVYLLSGIILFNFFTDAVGQGLSAIVNNASLITKVYVPKYIYPVTKVLSSSINLVISMIPLIIMALVTGAPMTKALLLLPFGLLCLLVFSIGLSLALSSAMVFFRDTQYLWGIISLAWMYATPLFYPENIIPAQYSFIHKLNPMYYIVKFVRTIFIEGISPEPVLYLYCMGSAVAMMIIGIIVFKKTQDRFVLYI